MGKRRDVDGSCASPFPELFGGVQSSVLSLFSDNNPFRRKSMVVQVPSEEGATEKLDPDKDFSKMAKKGRTYDGSENAQERNVEKKKTKKVEDPKIPGDAEPLYKKKKKRSKENEDASEITESRQNPSKYCKETKMSYKHKRSASLSLLQLQEEDPSKSLVEKARCVEVRTVEPALKRRRKSKVENIGDDYLKSSKTLNTTDIQGKAAEDIKKDPVKVDRSSRVETDMVMENSKTKEIKVREQDGVENAILVETEKLKRTIFVGNLPLHLKKKALIREFSQYGAIESARLRSVPLVDTKLPRKAAVITGHLNESRTSMNAYIVFKEPEAAKAALSHNMKEIHERHIRVDLAQAPQGTGKGSTSVNYDSTRSLFIGNLPFDAEDEEIYRVFSASNNPDLQVEAVRIVRDRQTSVGKGFAFVLFKTKAGLNFALSRGTLSIRERILRLCRASSKHKHTHAFGVFGVPSKKARALFKNKKSSLDRRSQISLQGRGQKLSRSAQPYEGARSSMKPAKLARWAMNPRGGEKIGGSERFKRNHASNASRVDVKKKRPAVAARKNHALKKSNAGTKNKSPKAGVVRKVQKR